MEDSKFLRAAVAGDLAMRDLEETMDAAFSETALAPIKELLEKADLRMLNLETPIPPEGMEHIEKSGAILHAVPKNLAFLKAGGFQCATLANNHIGDFGDEGVANTLRLLDEWGFAHTGAGLNDRQARAPFIFEKNGLRLGVLARAETEFGIADTEKPGAAAMLLPRMFEDMRALREKVDFLLVVLHGGNEYNPLPSPDVKERYRLIARFGADAVIAMHPHCPQGYEIFEGVPIVYSTGNFLFHKFFGEDTDPHSSWYYGYLPLLTFSRGAPVKLEIHPYRFDPDCRQITPFKGEEKEKMLRYLEEISAAFQDDERHRRLFRGWTTIAGPGYANSMKWEERYLTDPQFAKRQEMLALRNLWTCQAHNELMRVLSVSANEGLLEDARTAAEEVRRLQRMPV
ncbi:MAG: CapA family protein [Provencibacterium sp.]|jgi:hypothetical protein|nr:CapA family protein [Provencibacterium sp.]